ncbi:MAG: UDP-N-acetylmuramate:L-alanyl-gamma-D-glutamyl-meso-diaminopimelate ligase [Bdellovibrionaceae bacterium]|nr:UDP-N-acetylmuramate:L-alanyl-gamma-D-glutamyl-meso-diaminopimelate ligase [Pseudobdellovibrionaceae bacterium]
MSNNNLKSLKPGAFIYLMGICGTAMASLAGLLQGQGFVVGGSDSAAYPPMSDQLANLEITVKTPYSSSNLNPRPDLIIVGNVISKHFEEAVEMERLKIPYISLPQAISAFFIKEKKSVIVAGTHGKTTTTALMSWVFESCNLSPSFLIGGVAKNFSQSFLEQSGEHFIIEGDEYDTAFFDKGPKFLHYKPHFVILTGIEFDHADIYDNLDQVLSAFKKLVELIPKEGLLIVNSDDKNIKTLLDSAKINSKIIGFGFNKMDIQPPFSNHYVVTEYSYTNTFQNILVKDSSTNKEVNLQSTLFGKHNILNNLAVWVLFSEWIKYSTQQLSNEKVLTALQSFKGVKRRQDLFFQSRGIRFIEDFAHHPTAVSLTLDAIKNQYFSSSSKDSARGRVFAIFEPRSATSRRDVFQKAFVKAFDKADQVIIAKAYYQDKIIQTQRFSSQQLVEDINAFSKCTPPKAQCIDLASEIVSFLQKHLRAGDVVVIMSNGSFDGIYQKIKEKFSKVIA